MQILEGRSTSIELPIEYVYKIEEYVKPEMEYLYKNDVSGLVEQLINYNTINNDLPYFNRDSEKVYINQNAYREFVAKAKKRGYKNGLECLKDLIEEKEKYALTYGNDKKPESNPFAIEIGGDYYNLAKERGLLIVGDINSNKDKLANYIVNQLVRNSKGDETDIYEISGDECYHKVKRSPFEKNDESINASDFFDWLENIVEQRLNFLNGKGYRYYETLAPGYSLNMYLPHNFSRLFIVVDRDKMTEAMFKRLNNLCRINNKINGNKLFGLDIHIIAKASWEYFYDVVDSNLKDDFLDCLTALMETDGNDIEEGEKIAITWKHVQRQMIDVKGLFY